MESIESAVSSLKGSRLLTIAPVVIVDQEGNSDWFIYAHDDDGQGNKSPRYIIGTNGERLTPKRVKKSPVCIDPKSKCKKKQKECTNTCGDCGEFHCVENVNGKDVVGEPLIFNAD
jgi:hypothetical protein